MAEEDEKKIKKQRWNLEELEILYAYAKHLEPDERPNYAEVVELLAADGYSRTDNQVQKKFERMRWEAKNNSTTMLRRLKELIEGFKDKGDDDESPAKSNPTTPKAVASKSESNTPKSIKWTLAEMHILLKCMLEGNDKASSIQEKIPHKPREKIQSKLQNVKSEAKNQGTTAIDIVRRQIARLESTEQESDLESEEEEQLVKRGTKRKLEESADDRSAKKQRVIESPRLTGPKYEGAAQDVDGELKKLLEQLANNNRTNFVNLRTYIREKFDESRKENDELKSQVTMLEDKLDLMMQEVRSLKAANGVNSPHKTLTPSKTSAHTNGDNAETRQQISYYNFL